jgi:hypothetical protein
VRLGRPHLPFIRDYAAPGAPDAPQQPVSRWGQLVEGALHGAMISLLP